MTFDRRGVHAEGTDFLLSVGIDLIAHGGELAISARGIVSWIEHQENPGLLQQRLQAIGISVRG
jgi:hypothetical protein